MKPSGGGMGGGGTLPKVRGWIDGEDPWPEEGSGRRGL